MGNSQIFMRGYKLKHKTLVEAEEGRSDEENVMV